MRKFNFLFSIVLFVSWFQLSYASYEEVEGFSLKEVSLKILPKNFVKEGSRVDVAYYSDPNTQSRIAVVEIASPALMKLLLEEAMNKDPNFIILNKESVLIQDMNGELYHMQAVENGKAMKSWMLLLGEKQKWIGITGTFEEKYEADLSDDIRRSVLSVQWNKQKLVDTTDKINKGEINEDGCYGVIAKKRNDEKLCAKIGNNDIRRNCYSFIAENKKEYQICENIPKNDLEYRNCIFGIAFAKGECEKLKEKTGDSYYSDTCYSYQTSTIRITSKDNRCDVNKDGTSRDLCEKLKFHKATVEDLCQRITDPIRKKNCLIKDVSSTRVNYFDYGYKNPIYIPDECQEILGTVE